MFGFMTHSSVTVEVQTGEVLKDKFLAIPVRNLGTVAHWPLPSAGVFPTVMKRCSISIFVV